MGHLIINKSDILIRWKDVRVIFFYCYFYGFKSLAIIFTQLVFYCIFGQLFSWAEIRVGTNVLQVVQILMSLWNWYMMSWIQRITIQKGRGNIGCGRENIRTGYALIMHFSHLSHPSYLFYLLNLKRRRKILILYDTFR